MFIEEFFGALGCLIRIASQQALIELLVWLQHRFVSEHNVQELEARDMLAQHHEANGQGRRKQQAQRPPQPGPKDGRYDDRQRRETCP